MRVYAPAFEQEVRAKRQREADAARRRARILPPPLSPPLPVHVMYTGETADALRRAADGRRESAETLAKAIVIAALSDGYAETALGDSRAEDVACGHGKRPVGEFGQMTQRQCAVIYLIGSHGGASGWCGWSATALAKLMPGVVTTGNIQDAVLALAKRGMIERGPKHGNMGRLCRLTEMGRAVYAELSGDFGDG